MRFQRILSYIEWLSLFTSSCDWRLFSSFWNFSSSILSLWKCLALTVEPGDLVVPVSEQTQAHVSQSVLHTCPEHPPLSFFLAQWPNSEAAEPGHHHRWDAIVPASRKYRVVVFGIQVHVLTPAAQGTVAVAVFKHASAQLFTIGVFQGTWVRALTFEAREAENTQKRHSDQHPHFDLVNVNTQGPLYRL